MYSTLSWNVALIIAVVLLYIFLSITFKNGKIINKSSVVESVMLL